MSVAGKNVHLIGISGTGMGALAILLRDAGWSVSGSDMAFDPPIGPALEAAHVTLLRGYDAAHLTADLDLVVVGNAIRRDNVEAVAAEAMGLTRSSMSGALRDHFLADRRALIVAGTHGKTTTASMCAWLLDQAGLEPGYFIGGLPKNFASGAAVGSTRRSLVTSSAAHAAAPAPFVVEGDEYDAVYWDKKPKFLDYLAHRGNERDVVIVTSVEHDHVDIYPDEKTYEEQFRLLVSRVPETGLVVADASLPAVRRIVREAAKCEVAFYALDSDDTGEETPSWLAAPVGSAVLADDSDAQSFDLYAGGVSAGRFSLPAPGLHNARNAVASIAAAAHGFGVNPNDLKRALATFGGVKRRQDLLGTEAGVRVYDDFAHHPTAVGETLRALRTKHPRGELWAVFEPRSATACRKMHQLAYAGAFDAADHVLVAPLGRSNVPAEERLDVALLAKDLGARGKDAALVADVDAIVATLSTRAKGGDTVAILSNGAFGGVHLKILTALAARSAVV